MRVPFTPTAINRPSLLITCSSHEERCLGLIRFLERWPPLDCVLFHYDDPNPRREEAHSVMKAALQNANARVTEIQFTEHSAVRSLRENMVVLRSIVRSISPGTIAVDISVLTKRHLLMLLQWLDDEGLWERLVLIYSEPEDYEVSEHIPLSFGLNSLQQAPGFAACADFSRPVQLVLFLGYEGDRALAVYEHVQPMRTTLVIPDPPFRAEWQGRTERFNADLIALAGDEPPERVDAVDPDATAQALSRIIGDSGRRGECAQVVCPLGTKPQVVGLFQYVRACVDPPAVIYAGPQRHNHQFFSHGIGQTWVLKAPGAS